MPEEDEEEGVRSGRDHSWSSERASLTAPRRPRRDVRSPRCPLGARRLSEPPPARPKPSRSPTAATPGAWCARTA